MHAGEKTMTDNPTKRPRGRPFTTGNHGRPAGSKNRKTKILEGRSTKDQDRIVDRGYEIAMGGEPQLLKFFLSRILPKDRLIQIDEIPMGLLADEAPDVIAATLKAVCNGKITPAEGAAVAGIANQYARALEIADIITRLDAIEAKLPNGRR
jgi:hypothetical protein